MVVPNDSALASLCFTGVHVPYLPPLCHSLALCGKAKTINIVSFTRPQVRKVLCHRLLSRPPVLDTLVAAQLLFWTLRVCALLLLTPFKDLLSESAAKKCFQALGTSCAQTRAVSHAAPLSQPCSLKAKDDNIFRLATTPVPRRLETCVMEDNKRACVFFTFPTFNR